MYEKASLKSNTYLFIIRLLARATEDIFWKEKKKMEIRALKALKKNYSYKDVENVLVWYNEFQRIWNAFTERFE